MNCPWAFLDAFVSCAEAAGLRRLMGIKSIRLVGDAELLPNAVMERYWEKLMEMDALECEDWSHNSWFDSLTW